MHIKDEGLWRAVPENITELNINNYRQVWSNTLPITEGIVGKSGGFLTKINITNNSGQTWFLIPNANFLDIARATWITNSKQEEEVIDFSQFHNSSAPQLLHFQVLPIQVDGETNTSIWLYVSAKHFPTLVSLTLYSSADFYRYQTMNNSLSLTAISIMLLLGLLSFLIYTRTGHRIAITCAGYVGLHGVGWAAASGLVNDLFSEIQINWSYAGMYIFPFAIACACQFVSDLFECKNQHLKLAKFLNILTIICTFLGLSMALISFQLSFYVSHILAMIWILVTLSVSVIMMSKKDFRAKYFLIGNLLYSFSLAYYMAAHNKMFGALDNPEAVVLIALSVDCLCIILCLSEWFKLKQIEFNRHFYLSRIDPLTQLGNRYALNETLSNLGEHYFIVYIDFDGLKAINDKYGHAEGDKLIEKGAKLISNLIKPKGTTFRVGGDEFICVLSTSTYADLLSLQQIISQSLIEINSQLKAFWAEAGLSFGIANNQQGNTASECLSLADSEMYKYKQLKIRVETAKQI
ncbi:hypothetical protein XM47_15685 [Catenovulum maritimum]|uniref:diguanylate cyclase n=1 Tax=Catenovulum maritimum TaxID=1513271 RepID=A0A0J8GU60_9ALTE|nr:hypothetical protein XM47_15685 [Catenovulum maritimum]